MDVAATFDINRIISTATNNLFHALHSEENVTTLPVQTSFRVGSTVATVIHKEFLTDNCTIYNRVHVFQYTDYTEWVKSFYPVSKLHPVSALCCINLRIFHIVKNSR